MFDHDVTGRLPVEPDASSTAEKQATLEDCADPVFIANRAGFNIGDIYSFGQADHATIPMHTIFKLDAFTEEGASVVQQTPHGSPMKKVVKFAALSKFGLRPFKGKLQLAMPSLAANEFSAYVVTGHPGLKFDSIRASAFAALLQAAAEHAETELKSVNMFLHPTEVRAATAVKATLRLHRHRGDRRDTFGNFQ